MVVHATVSAAVSEREQREVGQCHFMSQNVGVMQCFLAAKMHKGKEGKQKAATVKSEKLTESQLRETKDRQSRRTGERGELDMYLHPYNLSGPDD